MKVVLYMAITANGMIAKNNNNVEWSNEEGKTYYAKVKEFGNLITGRITYPLYDLSDFSDMGNPFVVVLTKSRRHKDKDRVKYANSPNTALNILKQNGFRVALVAGGAKTNSSFLKEDLIDEIYLDIEPLIYAKGIELFFPIDADLKLKFLDQKMLNKNTIQLHYKILRQV